MVPGARLLWAGDRAGLPRLAVMSRLDPDHRFQLKNDPIKLVMAAAFAWAAKLPMYVFHSSAGVFGRDPFEAMAGVGVFVRLHKIPPA